MKFLIVLALLYCVNATKTNITPPTSENYVGCVRDDRNSRALSSMNILGEKNGPAACEEFCSERGYVVFGLQYTVECFCGTENDDIYLNGARDEKECKDECPDGSGAACGDFNRMNVYMVSEPKSKPKSEPKSNPKSEPTSYEYISCVRDNKKKRALSSMYVLKNNGPEACYDLCLKKDRDYAYFGLQYEEECFCGKETDNVFRTGSAPEEECDAECPDGSGEMCGGTHRMNVYSFETTTAPTPENETCSRKFHWKCKKDGLVNKKDFECTGLCDKKQCCEPEVVENQVCSNEYLCALNGLGDHKTGFECDGFCDLEQCCEPVKNEVCSKTHLCALNGLGEHKTGFECDGKCSLEECCEEVNPVKPVCGRKYKRKCKKAGLGYYKKGFECEGPECDLEQCCENLTCSVGFKAEKCKDGFKPDVVCNGRCDSVECCTSDAAPSPMPISTGTNGYHVRKRV